MTDAASERVHAIAEDWARFWSARDESSNEETELRDCLRELEARHGAEVEALGSEAVMAALFVVLCGAGTRAGAESATAFVWTRMRYAQWVEVARLVLEHEHAWYHLMWFCHRWLRIDFFAMARQHALALDARVAMMWRHRPMQLTLVEPLGQSSPERDIIEAAGVDPEAYWRCLREDGATEGRVEDLRADE